jgi:hypothetical protein
VKKCVFAYLAERNARFCDLLDKIRGEMMQKTTLFKQVK